MSAITRNSDGVLVRRCEGRLCGRIILHRQARNGLWVRYCSVKCARRNHSYKAYYFNPTRRARIKAASRDYEKRIKADRAKYVDVLIARQGKGKDICPSCGRMKSRQSERCWNCFVYSNNPESPKWRNKRSFGYAGMVPKPDVLCEKCIYFIEGECTHREQTERVIHGAVTNSRGRIFGCEAGVRKPIRRSSPRRLRR